MSKAQLAVEIFNQELAKGEDGLRKRVIDRIKVELSMGDAGASTYYQNTKKKAAGEKITHYKPKVKPEADDAAKPNDSKADQKLFSRCDVTDGVVTAVDCYTTHAAANEAQLQKGGYVFDWEVNIGDAFAGL